VRPSGERRTQPPRPRAGVHRSGTGRGGATSSQAFGVFAMQEVPVPWSAPAGCSASEATPTSHTLPRQQQHHPIADGSMHCNAAPPARPEGPGASKGPQARRTESFGRTQSRPPAARLSTSLGLPSEAIPRGPGERRGQGSLVGTTTGWRTPATSMLGENPGAREGAKGRTSFSGEGP
jgi:hypothetical protein